jgi:hypothetical protein
MTKATTSSRKPRCAVPGMVLEATAAETCRFQGDPE